MDTHQWQYDEMKQIGTDYESRAEIENYDLRMSKIRDIRAEIDEILEELGLAPEQTLLEFGCGTGEFAIGASARCRQVYALDVSRAMLEFAEKKARSRNSGPIRFINAGFLNYRHEDGPVDAVVTQLALHHLPDFWKQIALINIHGLLAPGGMLYLRDVVFSLKIEKYRAAIDHTLADFERSAGGDMAAKFANHVKNEFSTFDWIMEEMLYRAGFHIEGADYRENFMTVYRCRKAGYA